MRLDLPRRPGTAAIGLTPLIDVVFILLLFFLLASQFHQWQGLTMNAPGGAPADTVDAAAVLVRVHGAGRIDLNGEPIDPSDLDRAIAGYLTRDPALAVVVQPDADVALQPLVSVIDRLVAAGVGELDLR